MFIGHFAVGFAAKRWTRQTHLGVLLLAPLLLDVLWPVFCLVGIEQYRILPAGGPFTRLEFIRYPWSHSLAMSIVWGLLLAFLTIELPAVVPFPPPLRRRRSPSATGTASAVL